MNGRVVIRQLGDIMLGGKPFVRATVRKYPKRVILSSPVIKVRGYDAARYK